MAAARRPAPARGRGPRGGSSGRAANREGPLPAAPNIADAHIQWFHAAPTRGRHALIKRLYSLLALIRRVFNPPLALIRRFCGRYAFLGLYNYHVEKSCIKTGGKVKSFRRGLTW